MPEMSAETVDFASAIAALIDRAVERKLSAELKRIGVA